MAPELGELDLLVTVPPIEYVCAILFRTVELLPHLTLISQLLAGLTAFEYQGRLSEFLTTSAQALIFQTQAQQYECLSDHLCERD